MAAYLSPITNEMQADANGAPLVGGKVYTYLAGTTTAAATYTSSAGVTPQANPIILDSLGLPASSVWLAAGVSMKLVIKDSSDVTLRTIDNVLGINDPSAVATEQWVTFSGMPTQLSATSFSVAGDQTSTLHVGRRIKTTNAGGIVYSKITASSFGAGVTTITVSNDSGTLDAALSALSYSILSATNTSLPDSSAARLALGFTSAIVDRTYAEYTTNADLTTTIPYDDTIPQITEGTQILSVSITPKSATNRLRVRVQGFGSVANASDVIVAAVFVNAGTNAVTAGIGSASIGVGAVTSVDFEYEYVPGSTSAQTIVLRVGGTIGTIRLNGTTAARRFGGVARTTLVVEELTS